MAESRFAGFPAGRLQATVIPSLFFSQLLGQIDDLLELKLALVFFWRLGQKKIYPSFLTRRELEAEPVLRSGAPAPSVAIRQALDRLVQRGLLLHRTIELNRQTEECYFLNTASGRKAVRDLEAGTLDLGQVVRPEPPPTRPPRPTIFELYEQNVGLLTPLIVDELADAERLYPGEWIEEAFRQAVAYNRRNWRYIQRILQRWAVEGKRAETPGGRAAPAGYPRSNRPGR